MISRSAALVHRALRVDIRLIRSHLFRIFLLGFLVFSLHDAHTAFLTGAPGLEFFGLITLCNFWFVTFAGVTFFATAVTEEKEEQTLGLLKMAGISAFALLTGKWTPRLIGGVMLLTVQLPFTLLAITLGGVLWNQVIAAYCALLAHLVLVGCVGLFASVISSRSTSACIVATVILAMLFLLPPLTLALAAALQSGGYLPATTLDMLEPNLSVLVRASALTRLDEIQATNFNEPPVGFQVISNLVAGAGFFLSSWLLFGVCTRNESAALSSSSWWSGLSRWGRRRSRRAWNSALLWKDYYYSAGGSRALALKLVIYAGSLAACNFFLFLAAGRTPSFGLLLRQFGEMTMSLMLVLFLLESAVIAARCFRIEIRQRTWETLCMLPHSVSDIAYRKLASHSLSLLPVVVYFWFGAILAPSTIIDFLDAVFGDADAFLALVYALSQFLWVMHVIALLSITFDWAAWPVCIFFGAVLVFIWNMMFLTCLNQMYRGPSSEVLLFMICMFGCGQVAFTHWLIGDRLRILAGR